MSFLAVAGRLVDRIKINSLTRHERDGRAVWTKRRRVTAQVLVPLANEFFRAAGNPVTILTPGTGWHEWETESMRVLHKGEFSAWADEDGVLHVEEVPGMSISAHIHAGTVTEEMFKAAAQEFQRAHAIECEWFHGPWSHGDPHSGNVMFDPVSRRARLIDFEVRHDASLPPDVRHADDLLVFLQDSLGRLPRTTWLDLASEFVRSYGRSEITARLIERLTTPKGVARIWWAVRTTYLTPAELAVRLGELREALAA